jgi:hypothetical protein
MAIRVLDMHYGIQTEANERRRLVFGMNNKKKRQSFRKDEALKALQYVQYTKAHYKGMESWELSLCTQGRKEYKSKEFEASRNGKMANWASSIIPMALN